MDDNPYKTTGTRENQNEPKKDRPKFGVVKKILIALGLVMLLIILLFVWVGVKTATTYNKLEGKAEPLIRNVLENQSPWNYEKLKPYLSNLWIDSVSEEQGKKLMKVYSKLGKLESVNEVDWNGCYTNTTTASGVDWCGYIATAKYENGDALIFVGVVSEDDTPKIIQLHINSDVFLE